MTKRRPTKLILPITLGEDQGRDGDGFIHKATIHPRKGQVAQCDGFRRLGPNTKGMKGWCYQCYPEMEPGDVIYSVRPITVDVLLELIGVDRKAS